jgi:ATP-dependent protease ClpP protease subunit
MKDNEKMIGELARLTGQPVVKLTSDLKRDFYLTAPEAAAYGVVDHVRNDCTYIPVYSLLPPSTPLLPFTPL